MNSMSCCQLWWLTQEQKLVKYRLVIVNWIKKQYFWAYLWIILQTHASEWTQTKNGWTRGWSSSSWTRRWFQVLSNSLMRVFFLTSPCSGDYLAQRSWGPFNIFILQLSKHATLFIVIVIQVAGHDSWEHLVAEADVHRCLEGRLQRGGGGQGGQADGGQGGQGDQVLERWSSKPLTVFSSSQESRLGSLVWGQNDSGCRQSDISLAKGGWIQYRLSKMVANKLLSVLSWLIFMKSCFFLQKLKILMNFMGPAWLDFKPYKILSELPCEVL